MILHNLTRTEALSSTAVWLSHTIIIMLPEMPIRLWTCHTVQFPIVLALPEMPTRMISTKRLLGTIGVPDSDDVVRRSQHGELWKDLLSTTHCVTSVRFVCATSVSDSLWRRWEAFSLSVEGQEILDQMLRLESFSRACFHGKGEAFINLPMRILRMSPSWFPFIWLSTPSSVSGANRTNYVRVWWW